MTQSLEGHADHRYDGDLNKIHFLLLEMGGLALDQSRLALNSLLTGDLSLAEKVIFREKEIDAMEVAADNQIVDLISRHGPLAKDLRIIMAFSKAVAELERVGDEAVRIAIVAESMYRADRPAPNRGQIRDIRSMGRLAISVLEQALEGLDTLDAQHVLPLLDYDRELDAEFQSCLRKLTTYVLEDARCVGNVISITLVIKNLERLGEHARNLAEYIIFLDRGVDLRDRQIDSDTV